MEIHRDLKQFIPLNLTPVVSQLSHRCAIWKNLPLTPVGRVNLVKMTVLPRFTYLFRHTPIPIPVSFFNKLDSIITSFVWKGTMPRIAKSTLQLPVTLGGFGPTMFRKILLGSSPGYCSVVAVQTTDEPHVYIGGVTVGFT